MGSWARDPGERGGVTSRESSHRELTPASETRPPGHWPSAYVGGEDDKGVDLFLKYSDALSGALRGGHPPLAVPPS